MLELKLPEIVNPLSFTVGQDENGQPVNVTFLWRLKALNRENYPAFIALQDESTARFQRTINKAAQAEKAVLEAALAVADKKQGKPKKGAQNTTAEPETVSGDVARYANLDKALLTLGNDLEQVRVMYAEQGLSDENLDRFGAQIQAVQNFKAQMEVPIVKAPEELEQEIEERRAEYVKANEEKLDLVSRMLAHLCTKFYFDESNKIESNPENLQVAFDTDFIEKVVIAVCEAMKSPLVKAGSIAPS